MPLLSSDSGEESDVNVTRRGSSMITDKRVKEENQSPVSRKRGRRSTLAPQLVKVQPSMQPRKRGRPRKFCPARPTYAMMKQLLGGKWDKEKFEKIAEDKQDKSIPDLKVDIEVATRSGEGHAYWDSLTQQMGKKEQYEIDYIICTTKRNLGGPLSDKLLIKWTRYPIPSWESRKTTTAGMAIEMYVSRQEDLDFVEHRLRSSLGDDLFERMFPHRYLQYEAGIGDGGYVQNKRAIYYNILRSIEWRWNHVNRVSGQPLLYIEDWTDEPHDYESLLKFQFTNYLHNSEDVKEILKEHNKQLDDKKCCDGHCSTCMVQGKKGKEDSPCCGMGYTLDVDEEGRLMWDDMTAERANFECTPDCGCGPKCRNTTVTKGRQIVLCVFRERGKGWGVRAVQELPSCTYVSEYVGQMLAKKTSRKDPKWVYDIPLEFDVLDKNGKKVQDPLVISAANMGNESRFFNHSCEPNIRADTFIIERHGIWYNHIGFLTTKKVEAGEELQFDYFPNADKYGSAQRRMFNVCRCNSTKCRLKTPVRGTKKPLKKCLKLKRQLKKRLKTTILLTKRMKRKRWLMKSITNIRMEMRKTKRSLLSALGSALPIRKRRKDTEMENESDEEEVVEEMNEKETNEEESQEEREENK